MQIHDDFLRLNFGAVLLHASGSSLRRSWLSPKDRHPVEQGRCQSPQGHLQCDQTQTFKNRGSCLPKI